LAQAMEDCVFCRIAQGKEWAAVVWSDEEHIAFMDRYPASKGHTLVAPKRHFRDLLEMDEEGVGRLFASVARVAKAVHRALAPAGINVLQNNGSAAGQVIFHTHVHIIPRYGNPESLHFRSGRMRVTEEELMEVAALIRRYL
jgi:histidine triad (HIT) family protein